MVKLSRKGWMALSILFSLAVIVIIFVTTFNEETIGYILAFNLVFLGLAIIFRLLALVIWGLRIKVMSKSLGYHVTLPYCVNMVLAGLLAGTITPGQVGNDPVRVHELYRDGVGMGDAIAVVIMERFLDGVILAGMGILILFLMMQYFLQTFSAAIISLVIIALVFMISMLVLLVLAMRCPTKTKSIVMRLVNWTVARFRKSPEQGQQITDRAEREIGNFFEGTNRFTGSARQGLIAGGVLTAIFWITEFLVASIIMMGLGLDPYILESMFFQIILAIIMMIPLTPGSSGITELSTSSLYALIIPSGMIGIFVVLWRFVTFYLNILLGAIAGLAIFKRELKSKEKEELERVGQESRKTG